MRSLNAFFLSWLVAPFGLSGALPPDKAAVVEAVNSMQGEIHATAIEIWRLAETALREDQSAALLRSRLTAAGFSMQSGVAGMPTAFVATFGSGSPVIGILAEYDALPGIGNQAIPTQRTREDGVTSGHGCAHNVLGTAAIYGAIALKSLMVERGLAGTIKVFGCPAEELLVGKAYMARDGVFDGLDACIEWHPGHYTGVRNLVSNAMNSFTVEFTGMSAHAAGAPWNGRSALDAVELMNAGVNWMREHMPPEARVHYVITDGGLVPNVVPDRAKAWYFVRERDRGRVDALYARLLKMAEGAALMTETSHRVELLTAVYPLRFNRPLQEAMQDLLEVMGPLELTEEDQDFGRQMQREFGLPGVGFLTGVKPLSSRTPEGVEAASTDVGDVSFLTPTVGFSVAMVPTAVPGHNWGVVAASGSSVGLKATSYAAQVIGLIALELITNSELLARSRAYADENSEGPYHAAIPPDQQLPQPPR